MTCPTDNVLAELVDGALDDTTRVTIERHLDGCPACAELVGELARMLDPPPAAPPGYQLLRERSPGTWEAAYADDRSIAISFGVAAPGLATVRDPRVVNVREVGDGYVVHELTGETEREFRERRPRTRDEILAVWRQALGGLAALHRAGITHTLSPDHVFVDGERVTIGGFTTPVAKTAGYLAPERLRGEPPSPRADQFAACVAIWEALAGEKPFSGATVGALAVSTSMPPSPPDASYRPLVRGLSADPAARWADVDALAAALGAGPQTGAMLVALAMAALIVLLAVVAR